MVESVLFAHALPSVLIVSCGFISLWEAGPRELKIVPLFTINAKALREQSKPLLNFALIMVTPPEFCTNA